MTDDFFADLELASPTFVPTQTEVRIGTPEAAPVPMAVEESEKEKKTTPAPMVVEKIDVPPHLKAKPVAVAVAEKKKAAEDEDDGPKLKPKPKPAAEKKAEDDDGPKLKAAAKKVDASEPKPKKNKAAADVEDEPTAKRQKKKDDDPESTDSDTEVSEKKETKPKQKKAKDNLPAFPPVKYKHAMALVSVVMKFMQWFVQYLSSSTTVSFTNAVNSSLVGYTDMAQKHKDYAVEFTNEAHLNAQKIFDALKAVFAAIEPADTHLQITAVATMLREVVSRHGEPLWSLIRVLNNALKSSSIHDAAMQQTFKNFCYWFGSTASAHTPIAAVLNYLSLFRRRTAAAADKEREKQHTLEVSRLKVALEQCAPGLLFLTPFTGRYTLLVEVQADGTCRYRIGEYEDVRTGADFQRLWKSYNFLPPMMSQMACIGSLAAPAFDTDSMSNWITGVEADVLNNTDAKETRSILRCMQTPTLGAIVIARRDVPVNTEVTFVKPGLTPDASEHKQLVLRVTYTKSKPPVFHVGSVDTRAKLIPVIHWLLSTDDKPIVCFNVQSDLFLAGLITSEKPFEVKDKEPLKTLCPAKAQAMEIIELPDSPPQAARALPLASPKRNTDVIIQAAQSAKAKSKQAPEPIQEPAPKLTASEPKRRLQTILEEEKKKAVVEAAAAVAPAPAPEAPLATVVVVLAELWAQPVACYQVHTPLMCTGTFDEVKQHGAEWANKHFAHTGAKIEGPEPLPVADKIEIPKVDGVTGDTALVLPPNTGRLILVPRAVDPKDKFTSASLTKVGSPDAGEICDIRGRYDNGRVIELSYIERQGPHLRLRRVIELGSAGHVAAFEFKSGSITTIRCNAYGK